MIHYIVKFAAATGVIVWSCTTLLLFKEIELSVILNIPSFLRELSRRMCRA